MVPFDGPLVSVGDDCTYYTARVVQSSTTLAASSTAPTPSRRSRTPRRGRVPLFGLLLLALVFLALEPSFGRGDYVNASKQHDALIGQATLDIWNIPVPGLQSLVDQKNRMRVLDLLTPYEIFRLFDQELFFASSSRASRMRSSISSRCFSSASMSSSAATQALTF